MASMRTNSETPVDAEGEVRPSRAVRRTQAERTQATRAKLLDATVASLAELGYARTTTTEVAARAGVSRGAQLHHFPTKADLVLAAVEHLLDLHIQEFMRAVGELPASADLLGSAIDLLWEVFQGDSAVAWIELIIAGRTDPELQVKVSQVGETLGGKVGEAWIEVCGDLLDDPEYGPFLALAPSYLFTLLTGLAVTTMTGSDRVRDEAEQVLEATHRLAALLLPVVPAPARSSYADPQSDTATPS